jgi:hypothetical protein
MFDTSKESSMSDHQHIDELDLKRRAILQTAGAAMVGGLAASATLATPAAAQVGPLDHMSPVFPRKMHICFHIRDDVDFNKFIADLEAESARRGMTQVRANRVITVASR